MSRLNIILAGLAVVQILILLLTGGEAEAVDGRDALAGTKPFVSLVLKDLTRLEITDDDLRTVAIERLPEADEKKGGEDAAGEGEDAELGRWILASKDGFPVRATNVQRAVEDLQKLRMTRVLTTRESKFTGLEVSDSRFARHVKLIGQDGKLIGDFYLGDGPRSNTVHYREAGGDRAYEASGLATYVLNADDGSWINSTFTELDSAKVQRVRLEHGDTAFEIARQEKKEGEPKPTEGSEEKPKKGEGEKAAEGEEKKPEPSKPEKVWVVVSPEDQAGRELDQAKAGSFVASLSRLYLGAPVGRLPDPPGHGLDSPTAKAVLIMENGSTHTLTVGAKREGEEDYYATRSDWPWLVTLRSWSVTGPFQKPLKDLLPEEEKAEDQNPEHEAPTPPEDPEKGR